jgi:hypothetical protein
MSSFNVNYTVGTFYSPTHPTPVTTLLDSPGLLAKPSEKKTFVSASSQNILFYHKYSEISLSYILS